MTLLRTPAVRRQRADLGQQVEEAVGGAEPTHPAQHRLAGVLEGQVEVGRDARRGGDRLDQPRPGLGRLQVAGPDPDDAVDRGELRQQLLQQPGVAEVLAVRGGVLADQDQLADALLGQPLRLGEQLVGRAGDERAAEGGDGAERAAPVAAAGQLERGDRAGVEPAAQHRTQVRRGVRGGRRGVGAGGRLPSPWPRDTTPLRAGHRGQRQQLPTVPGGVRRRAARRRGPPSSRAAMSG